VLEHQPSQDILDEYYSSSYVMSADEIIASEHRRIFRLPEQYWLISQLQKQGLKSGDRTLDIGCDKGYFLDICRRFGFEVCGIEPSQSAKSYTMSIGLNIAPSIKDIQPSFQALTLWHVLEHFTEPRNLLEQCQHLLDDNGFIFIRVPDFASFWSRVLGRYWIWFQPHNHYVHYSKKSLCTLIESVGFEVVECYSRKPNDNHTFKAGILADRTLRNSFSYKQSARKFLGRLYEHLTGVEIFLVARKRKAPSI
jgi:2-polyprenyl-3-methyl-5-hydroxy-6-metoxy-1,4-benzoquinol methylase